MKEAVNRLHESVELLREELRNTKRALWAGIAIGITATLLIVGVSYRSLDQNQEAISAAIAESNRKFCPILLIFVPRPGEPGPSTGRGQIVAERVTALAREFGCI